MMTGALLLAALVVTADAAKPSGGPLPNLSSMACVWDGRRLGWTPNDRRPITNFVERERHARGIADADYWASPDDSNPFFSLENGPAKEFFVSRLPVYAEKASRVAPRVSSVAVPPDGVLSLPVSFVGNGASFVEVEGNARRSKSALLRRCEK